LVGAGESSSKASMDTITFNPGTFSVNRNKVGTRLLEHTTTPISEWLIMYSTVSFIVKKD
jgi:hypothetical protein